MGAKCPLFYLKNMAKIQITTPNTGYVDFSDYSFVKYEPPKEEKTETKSKLEYIQQTLF